MWLLGIDKDVACHDRLYSLHVSRLSSTHGYFDYLLNEKALFQKSVSFREKLKAECYSAESACDPRA